MNDMPPICWFLWYFTVFTNALAKYVYMTYTRKPNFSSCMQLCLFRSPAYDRTGWVQPVTPTVVSVYCLASDKWRERKPSSEHVTRDLTKNSSLPYYLRTCIIRRFRYKNSTLRRYRRIVSILRHVHARSYSGLSTQNAKMSDLLH